MPTTSGGSSQPFGFTGEQRDAGTGLVYLRARMYDPTSGRFLQRDPYPGMPTSPSSLHRYTYVENNPVNATDPSGLAAKLIKFSNQCLIEFEDKYLINVIGCTGMRTQVQIGPLRLAIDNGRVVVVPVTGLAPSMSDSPSGNPPSLREGGAKFRDHFFRQRYILEKVVGKVANWSDDHGKQFVEELNNLI